MKIHKLSIPLSMTMALAAVVTCSVSCAKKNNAPEKTTPEPARTPTNSVAENLVPPPLTNAVVPVETNTVATNIPPVSEEITNAPPAETTTKAPEIALNETNVPGHQTVVEMATNPPVAPTSFYPVAVTSNTPSLAPVGGVCETNYFVSFRGGYQHIYHGENNDSYWLSAKFYAYGDALREGAGKNGWLIPDAAAEISTSYLPKPDNDPHPGSHDGYQFRADFTWPWFHWTCMSGSTNSVCPFCKSMTFALGPTVNVGFDHLFHESQYRFANYAGARLTFNRSGFIEYTVGRTEGLDSIRQQVVAELPFYESRDGEVRYVVRGLWNHGVSSRPDVLEGGIFMEMSLGLLVSPEKWGDLIPFAQ